MWCATGNPNYMSHICAKGFLNSNLNHAVIDKISNFQKIVQISHIYKKKKKMIIFKSIIVTF